MCRERFNVRRGGPKVRCLMDYCSTVIGSHGEPTLSNFVTGEEPSATADAAARLVPKTLIGGRSTEPGVDSRRPRMPQGHPGARR